MDTEVRQALEKDRLVDITTIGRKTGKSWRKEIGFQYVDGTLYLSGQPGPRGWYANLLASAEFTFHLKQSVQRDLAARARPIRDKAAKRAIFSEFFRRTPARQGKVDVEVWVEQSPLVEVELVGQGP